MKQSNKLIFILTGILYILVGFFFFVNPVENLVSISWLISLGLFIGAIASLIHYFSLPKAFRHWIYLLEALVNAFIAFYLFTGGFAVLPVVVPTVIGFWLIIQSIIIFFKGQRLGFVFPIVGSSVVWGSVFAFLLGLVLVLNPLGTSVFLMYLIAFSLIFQGIGTIVEGFRKE